MRQALIVVTFVLSMFVPLTAAAQSLVGVWTIEETAVSGGDNPGTFTGRPGTLIFTERHFSQVVSRGIATGNGPRPKRSENPTDAERLASVTRFYAGSGTYTLDGSALTRRMSIAMNPNNIDATTMSEVRFEGDDTVWHTFHPNVNGRPLSDITVVQKMVRAE